MGDCRATSSVAARGRGGVGFSGSYSSQALWRASGRPRQSGEGWALSVGLMMLTLSADNPAFADIGLRPSRRSSQKPKGTLERTLPAVASGRCAS